MKYELGKLENNTIKELIDLSKNGKMKIARGVLMRTQKKI